MGCGAPWDRLKGAKSLAQTNRDLITLPILGLKPLLQPFTFANEPSPISHWEFTLRTNPFFASAFLSVLCIAGCNSGPPLPATVPAEGSVSLDGAPVSDVTIVFIAEQGNYNASGVTDKNGKFSMKAFDTKNGAVPGSYKVELNKTVVESKDGRKGESEVNLKYGLPKKYASFVTSGLTITLTEAGNKDIKYDLKSK